MRQWKTFVLVVVLCAVGAGCGRKTETPPKTTEQTTQVQPKTHEVEPSPPPAKPTFTDKAVPERQAPGIGDSFIANFCNSLYYENKTTQQRLNLFLKTLDAEGKEYENTSIRGDLFNLRGRFYYYKIFLDRKEKLFEGHLLFQENWKQIWQDEAVKAFEAAKAAYESPGARTVLNLPVKPWMPEGEEAEARFIKYAGVEQAAFEMQEWLARVREGQ